MIESANFCQQGVAADFVDEVLADIGHLHTVLECPRCAAREFAQCRGVGVGYLHQCQVGGDMEHFLIEIDEGVGEEC